jgi:membrane-associated phospholipid phosphatase
MYGVMKAVFQRQRPYTGVGEGKFFSGNWTNGSFPSGHAMFAWTIASTVAHQYHSVPLDLLLYGLASSVSVTRVTAGQHFPSDVFVGSILGYLIGDYVAHKPESGFPVRTHSKFKRVPDAILQHVTIGIQ